MVNEWRVGGGSNEHLHIDECCSSDAPKALGYAIDYGWKYTS